VNHEAFEAQVGQRCCTCGRYQHEGERRCESCGGPLPTIRLATGGRKRRKRIKREVDHEVA